jgi:hypothetical protein
LHSIAARDGRRPRPPSGCGDSRPARPLRCLQRGGATREILTVLISGEPTAVIALLVDPNSRESMIESSEVQEVAHAIGQQIIVFGQQIIVLKAGSERAQWHGIARTLERTTGLEIRSSEQFGLSAHIRRRKSGTIPAIICSTVSRHVFLTCHDCPIGWNRFCPNTVFVRRCLDTVC